ncbi:MAG: head-tail joining protein [Microcoleus sp.]
MLLENLDLFMTDFSTPIEVTQGGQTFMFSGIFDEGDDPMLNIGSEGRSIVVYTRTSNVVAIHHGAALTVKGKNYKVVGKAPDPDGEFTELNLHEDFNIVAPGVEASLKVAFAHNVASPHEIVLLPGGSTLLTAQIVILQPFNGTGASLRLVDESGFELMSVGQNNPYEAAEFEVNPGREYSSSSRIRLLVNPGTATQGRGLVVLEI